MNIKQAITHMHNIGLADDADEVLAWLGLSRDTCRPDDPIGKHQAIRLFDLFRKYDCQMADEHDRGMWNPLITKGTRAAIFEACQELRQYLGLPQAWLSKRLKLRGQLQGRYRPWKER